jgi:hypothetical protein
MIGSLKLALGDLMLAVFLTHWFHFYFWGGPSPVPVNIWYERGVWGNVFAVLPLAPIGVAAGIAGYIWHKRIIARLHRRIDGLAAAHDEHAVHLKALLDAMDPETDGGITVLHERLDKVADDLDPLTPGGLGVINKRFDSFLDWLPQAPSHPDPKGPLP